MPHLLTLSSTFTVEDEASPDLGEILALVEERVRCQDGVFAAAADVARKVRTFTILVQVEGEGMGIDEIEAEIEGAIRDVCPKFVRGVRMAPPLLDEID